MRTFMRKYISNRGSALFMVISTMTALMLSCMAMYFSVISSRSTQYAIFNQQQSKQVSMSIGDTILAGFMDMGSGSALSTDFNKLFQDMLKLDAGGKISTESNGFADFDDNGVGKEADNDLGAYKIDITCLSKEGPNGPWRFDITVTTRVNGSNSVYHTMFEYAIPDGEPVTGAPTMTDIFAATGYVPNDVYLDGGKFLTDLFYDNELTIINAYGGKDMKIWGDLASGGSILSYKYIIPATDRVQTFAIRDTYTANFNGAVTFAGSPYDKSLVLVGGDVILDPNKTTDLAGAGFENANVYILGDLYLKGVSLTTNSNYFVDGTVYYMNGTNSPLTNVYCNGVVDLKNNNGIAPGGAATSAATMKTTKSWYDKAAEDENVLGVQEMIDLLKEKTASHDYYKWIINDNDPFKDKYVKELNESDSSTVVKKTLKFVTNGNAVNWDKNKYVPTIVLKYDKNGEQGCIIEDIIDDAGNMYNNRTIIIDTGDDEDNVYTIRVKPNRDMDGDNIKETFTWLPSNLHVGSTSSNMISVLIKGRGSVVIEIPKGVTYQDVGFQKTMHYNWFVLAEGETDTSVVNQYGERYNSTGKYWESSVIYKPNTIDTKKGKDADFEQFVHKVCKTGDGCEYSEIDSESKCAYCDNPVKIIHCKVHDDLREFCPNCHPELVDNHEGACKDHVDRLAIDSYLAAHSDIMSKMEKDADGKIIYPTTNIFLVSADESASIRLSSFATGGSFMQNGFFGFIYAPYMTFKGYGNNQGGNLVRLMGGMTVSDYILDDSMSFLACWPEKMPSELMNDESKKTKLDGVVKKSWKITPIAH